MNQTPERLPTPTNKRIGWWLLLAAFVVTIAVYWPGLSGGFLFDDYPNIVDNHGVQPSNASFSSLVGAALSSPSSEFKRPLASLSFAANYLISGLDPYWMKLTNLFIHLLNGLLVFLLARALLRSTLAGARSRAMLVSGIPNSGVGDRNKIAREQAPAGMTTTAEQRAGSIAALIAGSWMLLPINLTGVLYVVQRMESMANLFVPLGLLGYIVGRQRMLTSALAKSDPASAAPASESGLSPEIRGFLLCVASIVACTGVGVLAKETAVMLPLYAALVEWLVFGFRAANGRRDLRLAGLFVVVLLIPMLVGLAWLTPGIFNPNVWATRDFSLRTRLLSEARIVVDYVRWTLLPTPDALSFYHDDFRISTGLVKPWTTLASIVFLGMLASTMVWLRKRLPLAALGIGLFLGCQLLTGTILPLELIYEHRNYFASFGLMLAIVPLLAAPRGEAFALPRHVLLGALLACWVALTALTAYAWGNPLRLAEDLASRAPLSPRAQYELGRTYIIYSHYDPASPFTPLAYAPLERAAALPESSILPEQALIFMNSRMNLPIKDAWWDSLIAKLKSGKPGVQDESSLGALTQCAREQRCNLSKRRMVEAYAAALSHQPPSARLLSSYGDYAWNVLDDHALGLDLTREAVKSAPEEPAYRITLIRMLASTGNNSAARDELKQLEPLNYGGRLDATLMQLRTLPGLQ